MTGAGHVAYIAQNGIQVSFGGSATVTGNTVSAHWYTPDATEACGLLFYQAGAVKATANGNPTAKETAKQMPKANKLFDNELNICTVA